MSLAVHDKKGNFDRSEYGQWEIVRFYAHFYQATVK